MTNHLGATASTLLIYLLLAASYYGWGGASLRLLRLSDEGPESPVMPIWIGWAMTLFLFQLLHLVLPITPSVAIPVFVLGLAFSIPLLWGQIARLPDGRPSLLIQATVISFFFLSAVYIASRAMLPPTNYDSGLYHFNAVRWVNSYPIVPGLGNLAGRLAFNQSFFVYAATLNVLPPFEHGRSLANSFLLLLTLATLTPSLLSIARRPSLLLEEHPFKYAADLLLLPTIVFLALFSNGLTSPTPDLASTLLQSVMFVMLAHGLADWLNGRKEQNYRVAILVILATTAVTIKLSNLAVSAVIIGFAVAYFYKVSGFSIKGACRLFLPSTIILLLWGLRGFILSGAPLYPSTIGYASVEWSVPRESVVEMANWIYSWARVPNTQWKSVLGGWGWLHPWFLRMRAEHMADLIYPLLTASLLCLITAVVSRFGSMRRPQLLEWSILLPSTVGLLYWFLSAPEPRFTNAIVGLAVISAALLFLLTVRGSVPRWIFLTTFCFLLVAADIQPVFYSFQYRALITVVSTSGWQPIPQVPLKSEVTASGLTVYVPVSGDQGWDSSLPSTPNFDARLRLINPADMSSGFTVRNEPGR